MSWCKMGRITRPTPIDLHAITQSRRGTCQIEFILCDLPCNLFVSLYILSSILLKLSKLCCIQNYLRWERKCNCTYVTPYVTRSRGMSQMSELLILSYRLKEVINSYVYIVFEFKELFISLQPDV